MFGLSAAAAVLQGLLMACLPPTPHFLMLKGQEAEAERVIVKLKLSTNPRQKMANIRHSIQAEESPASPVCFCCGTNSSAGTHNSQLSCFLLTAARLVLNYVAAFSLRRDFTLQLKFVDVRS